VFLALSTISSNRHDRSNIGSRLPRSNSLSKNVPDFGEIDRKMREAQSSRLRRMPTDKVIEYKHYFARQSFGESPQSRQYKYLCQTQLTLIQNELQHRGTLELDTKAPANSKWTLRWAIVVGVTRIALVLIEISPLIHRTFFRRAQPANAPQATPAMPRQKPTARHRTA